MKSTIVSLLFFIPLWVGAQSQKRTTIDLSGKWLTELGTVSLPGSVDQSRLAPANTDTNNTSQLTRLHPFTGKLNYTRTFTVPADLTSKEWSLFLERTKITVVIVDGDTIGSSNMILTPQTFRIGKLAAGVHNITIGVDNSDSAVPRGIFGSHAWTDATQTNWNGIIGIMELQADDGIRINQAQVYPSPDFDAMPVQVRIFSAVSENAILVLKGRTWNTSDSLYITEQRFPVHIKKGEHDYKINLDLGNKRALWSEFNPSLYHLEIEVQSGARMDYYSLNFGIRDFSTSGTQFIVNGKKAFLRGKNDGCVFPLTGYPPMDKLGWKTYMLACKDYGLNHIRFHSWTPPQAAFDAANELGIYMQPELPYWGTMHKDSTTLNFYLMETARALLDVYGNNPSFVMMAMGNELRGDQAFIKTLVDSLRDLDNRHLYALGSNNHLGTAGQKPGDDFFVTCRVGGKTATSDYSTHARASFSFADAVDGGILNGLYPSSDKTFRGAVEKCTVPVVAHETGQYQVYPNYDEIKKYTGVLYPYNYEVFRKRITEKGMPGLAPSFHRATARFAAVCYKEDIEMCLRTDGFGGFQLLDLQDYPGQGTALIGLLDAFMDAKGAISPVEFRGFCSDIVPLAYLPKYCWINDENFQCNIALFNFSDSDLRSQQLNWQLVSEAGTLIQSGFISVDVEQGKLDSIGSIDFSLVGIKKASKLKLTLNINQHTNTYNIWVYPKAAPEKAGAVYETKSLDDAIQNLKKGKKVLFVPSHEEIAEFSVGGMFTPDYWNFAMFKSISERLNRAVSPGTMSILTNPDHALFNNFPTEFHSNWQWWTISKNSRPLILDNTDSGFLPLIQVVDNVERNHKLGLLFELSIGKGKLMVSMCNLSAVAEKPEGRAFRDAILRYMNSSDFSPRQLFSENQLRALFQVPGQQRKIDGVENISTYE